MTTLSDILAALHSKGGFELVNKNETLTRLRLVGRVPKVHMGSWLVLINRLIAASDSERPWSVDISKWHFNKDGGRKTVFAWRLIFQAEEVGKQLADIVNIIKTSPGAKSAELEEIHLYGRADNNTAGGKRGAGPTGTIAVGQLAVMRKGLGG